LAVSVTLRIGRLTFTFHAGSHKLNLPIARGRGSMLLVLTVSQAGNATKFAAVVARS
jgi:hypothetical protein